MAEQDDIMTIPEMMRYRWETEPEARVFSFLNKEGPVMSLTSGEVYTLAGRFASRLRRYGFQAGDVIANGLPNSPERLITDMGIICAGCATVNCQVVEKDGSNFYNVARMSRCRGVIIPKRDRNDAYTLFSPYISGNSTSSLSSSSLSSLSSSSQCFDLSVQQAPSLQKAIIVNRADGDPENSLVENLKSCSDEEILCPSPSPSDLVILFATSGSTGFSKLVPASHEAIFRHARCFQSVKGVTTFSDRPMGWLGGFPFEFLGSGAKRFVQDQFDNLHAQEYSDLWQVMIGSGCTGAALMPGDIYGLIDMLKDNPPETMLQFISTGGQAMTRKIVDALGLICKYAIVVSYGSTEAGIACYHAIMADSTYKDYLCGKPMKDVELKIVDAENGEVETGKEGHLLVKSSRLFSNYYNLETTATTTSDLSSNSSSSSDNNIFTPDGFFKTGDRARLDSEGNLFCYGRYGDVVSLNGTLFYMTWPEKILTSCPFLQDSCVIGVEEADGSAFLCACAIPKAGESDVTASRVIEFFDREVVDDAQQTSSMVKLTHVFMMDSFPTVSSGKVDKMRLRKMVFEKLGRSSS